MKALELVAITSDDTGVTTRWEIALDGYDSLACPAKGPHAREKSVDKFIAPLRKAVGSP